MINDVKTKKMRTYNFVSGPIRPALPLARTNCGPIRDGSLWANEFNIPTYSAFFCAGLRTSLPGPPQIAIPYL